MRRLALLPGLAGCKSSGDPANTAGGTLVLDPARVPWGTHPGLDTLVPLTGQIEPDLE
jgi:hypothetical protein